MKTWVLVQLASGKKEWMEQYKCDYAWQTGQIPGAKAVRIVHSRYHPTWESDGYNQLASQNMVCEGLGITTG